MDLLQKLRGGRVIGFPWTVGSSACVCSEQGKVGEKMSSEATGEREHSQVLKGSLTAETRLLGAGQLEPRPRKFSVTIK